MQQNNLVLEQMQALSGAQIQSLKILEFTNQELDAFMQTEYLENPLLDVSTEKQGENLQCLEKFYENGSVYHGPEAEADEDNDRRQDIRAKDPDWLEHMILEQLYHRGYNAKEWKLMHYLIRCLDERGFFPYTIEEISNVSGYDADMIKRCIKDLKELEPPGIFAKDLSECLVLQLGRKGVEDKALLQIVEKFLPDILQGHISKVTRELHISTAKAKEYMHLITTLNPRPLILEEDKETQYIVPDVIATREEDCWKIRMNDNWMGEYHLNEYYLHMIKTAQDQELKTYFAGKLERARYMLGCIEQRKTTVRRVVETILTYQEEYFLCEGPLKPMTLEYVAHALGMHTSTVSRAIKGKYLQFRKTVLLKDLFSSSLPKETDMVADEIKKKIKVLIEEENKEKPLSDLKLEKLLAQEGLSVSRRTITKYRGQMGIPDSKLRAYL